MKKQTDKRGGNQIVKNIAVYGAAVLLTVSAFSSYGQSPEKIATPAGPYPVVKLPADADPNGPDWLGIDLASHPPVLPLSPAEEAKKFILQPGYKMEPVLTDPQIQQPAAIAFDGNGRMYVLEIRTYMLDADSKGELEPNSRISRWEDKNGDGVYETSTVFVDKLLFPRFAMPYGADCILAMESNADNVYKYTDTNKDGVADKKELFTTKFGRSGNVEHQQAFLYWGMDNWLYSTYNAFRVRFDGSARETTGANGSQWGVTQDNDGKVWFQGGASGVPSYFQFPIHYGRFTVDDQLEKDFNVPYGAPVLIADMQGGMDEVRMPDGSLAHTTGAAGNDVFRGTKLPKDMVGQYFYGEAVARIVRQINPTVTDGLTQLHNVYGAKHEEFIRSTDPLFRPVDMTTAPDGTMYITDMYHGIIQEGQWTQKGTYLRTKIEQYQLDKVVSKGRIWRLTYQGMERDKTQPKMLDETAAQLATHLNNPNGWWRDMAQQLIILKGDKSIVPTLQKMARTDKDILARFHAAWTLEGLNALDAGLVRELMKDANPRMQIQGIRLSESLYKGGDKSFAADYKAFATNPNVDVALQSMMTMNTLKVADANAIITSMVASNQSRGIQVVGGQILKPAAAQVPGNNAPVYTAEQKALLEHGALIFQELCSQCHGENGTGTPVSPGVFIAPAFAGNQRVQGHSDYMIKVLLKGMTGEVDGKNYAGGVMVSMAENSDEWVASIASYVRNNFTNSATFVTPADVAKVRAAIKGQTGVYKYNELIASVPQVVIPQSNWKASASNNKATLIGGTGAANGAFNFEGWTTGTPQQAGMWFQVEMPTAIKLAGFEFESTPFRQPAPAGAPAPAAAAPGAAGGRGGNAFAQRPSLPTAPKAYTVEVSTDGNTWTKVAEGSGGSSKSAITFAPVQAKYFKITETATDETSPWSMSAMKVYEVAK